MRLRVRESPTGGSRIAFGYLGSLLGLVLVGLVLVTLSPLAPVVCGDVDDIYCVVGWSTAAALIGLVLGAALVAWVLRLGWEWWAVVAAVVVLAPLVVDSVPSVVAAILGVLTPGLAGAATWSGPRRPAWRPWAIGVGAVGALAVGVASILV